MIPAAIARMLGKRRTGLRHEPQRGTDRVWLADEGGRSTDAARVKVHASAGAGASLEEHCPPIGDQWGSSCVGEMAHALIAIVESVYGLPYDPPSPLAAYLQSVMTHTDPGMPPVDDGTYIRGCLSEIRAKGCGTLAEWPRIAQNLMRPVPHPVRAHGVNRRGLVYDFIRPLGIREEMEMTDAAIALKQPVGFGWTVTERYAKHRGEAPYDARWLKSDRALGGHAQVQISARDSHGIVRFRNSWSKSFADGGNINIIADTVTRRDLVLVSGWDRLVQHA